MLAAWLAAAAGIRMPVLGPAPAETDAGNPADPVVISIQAEADRLRAALSAPPSPRGTLRNPFRFAQRDPRPLPRFAVENDTAVQVPPIAPGPALKLAGIAEDIGAEGPVRTAIISVLGQLILAREGEEVTPRYRVVKIGADAVELQDLVTDAPVRIGLR